MHGKRVFFEGLLSCFILLVALCVAGRMQGRSRSLIDPGHARIARTLSDSGEQRRLATPTYRSRSSIDAQDIKVRNIACVPYLLTSY